jgi:hypothetical protein
MRYFASLRELLQSQVSGQRTQAELLDSTVNRISAETQGSLQLFKVSGRSQEFRNYQKNLQKISINDHSNISGHISCKA